MKANFLLIPDELLEREDLSAAEKLVLGQIGRLQGKKSCCFPSYPYIARKLGLSERQVIRVVNELAGRGELTRLHHARQSNTYAVPWVTARNLRHKWAMKRQQEAAKEVVAS